MTCREFSELLVDLVADELPADGKARAENHLIVCPPCVALAESYRLTILLARHQPPLPMPGGLAVRLREAARQQG